MLAKDKVLSVDIKLDNLILKSDLFLPKKCKKMVIFAQSSSNSRLSPHNRLIAQSLNAAGFGTLLFDLLTAQESAIDTYTREHRFNISVLAKRLEAVTDWLIEQLRPRIFSLGYFGASTGVAAALVAAAERAENIKAIVSWGGRPDLAGQSLSRVKASTLLIVGEADPVVVTMNEQTKHQFKEPAKLMIVPGASHAFAEPGAVDEVIKHTTTWFKHYLA
jgi:dienelactone hydrolase